MGTNATRKQYRNNDIKKILPLKQSIESIKEVETSLHTIECTGLNATASAANQCCDLLQNYAGAFPGMNVFLTNSKRTISTLHRVGMEITDLYHKVAADWMLVSREVIGCQSSDELYTLQRMAMNQLSKRWHEEVSRIICTLCGASEGLCPLPLD